MGCIALFLPLVLVEAIVIWATGHAASGGAVVGAYLIASAAFVGWNYLEPRREAKRKRQREAWLATLSPEEREKVERQAREVAEARERAQKLAREESERQMSEAARDARLQEEIRAATAWNYQCRRCKMRIHRDATICPYCHSEFVDGKL